MNLIVKEMIEDHIEECTDLYMSTFSQEPWYDQFESKEQVVKYFKNFMKYNSFLGYVGILDNKIVALSVGMKKPWIKGEEYYIDEFCVDYSQQGKGIGSLFLKQIEEFISDQQLNGIFLNTEEAYPSYEFYRKNGFEKLDGLVILVK